MKNLLRKARILSMVILVMTFLGCEDDDEGTALPEVTAGFTFDLIQGSGTVSFINISENAQNFEWDFGNGTTSTEINPTVSFESGTYTVSLTASNVAGASDTFEDQLVVVIPEAIMVPITFDDTNVNYEVGTFGGVSFEIVANPAPGGSNSTPSQVGAITNVGAAFEGFFFDLGEALDLATEKTVTINFWSESAIDVLLKLEQGTGADVEVSSTHGGTGWEMMSFDFTSADSFSRMTFFVDGPGTTAGTFYIDDVEQMETAVTPPSFDSGLLTNGDFENGAAPWIQGVDDNNPAPVTTEGDNSFYSVDVTSPDPGQPFLVNLSQKLEIVQDETYALTFDAWSNGNRSIIAGIGLSGGDFSNTTETVNITDTRTTYTVTLTASGFGAADARVLFDLNGDAGLVNIDNVSLVVSTPSFDSGLLSNGDFENGAAPWIQGVDDNNPAPVTTEGDNSFYSVDVTSPDPGQPFLVNLSQKLEITQGETYTLTFDAWSNGNRSIIAGIGLSGGDFSNTTETVNITNTRTTYSVVLTAAGFGAPDARVLFDLNGEAGVVNIDDVSLVVGGTGGGDTTAPVITLNGEAMINVMLGDTFTDPGATATDDVDGDLTANIMVGGDTVDTNTEGTYIITYNVSDAAGNAAAQVSRTVVVEGPFDGGLLTNGDFENGAAPWIQGVDDNNPAPVVTENGNSFYSVNITNPDPGQPFLVNLSQKLEIIQDQTYTLTFDAWSDTSRSIIAGIGLSGGSFANTAETVNITTTQATYTLSLTATGFGAADARVLFDSNGEAGLVNIDNVSLVVDNSGSGGGSGCTGPSMDVATFPVDFENCEGFNVSFGSLQTREIVSNPVSGGINTSEKVYQFVKPAGAEGFGGFQNIFNMGTFTNNSTISFKIYSTLPNQEVRLEIVAIPNDGGAIGNPAPYNQTLTTANEWVEMSFDLSANAFPNSMDESVYTMLVVKPGNIDGGNTPADVTFYVDDFTITAN